MNAEELRARLIEVVTRPHDGGVVYGDEVLQVLDAPAVPAAVLVPVVLGSPPGILLTKRNAHLNKHAGQVSFPGGRIDPGETAEAAALREADLIAFCRGRLADFKCPKKIHLVVSIPRTATGKIQRLNVAAALSGASK